MLTLFGEEITNFLPGIGYLSKILKTLFFSQSFKNFKDRLLSTMFFKKHNRT